MNRINTEALGQELFDSFKAVCKDWWAEPLTRERACDMFYLNDDACIVTITAVQRTLKQPHLYPDEPPHPDDFRAAYNLCLDLVLHSSMGPDD